MILPNEYVEGASGDDCSRFEYERGYSNLRIIIDFLCQRKKGLHNRLCHSCDFEFGNLYYNFNESKTHNMKSNIEELKSLKILEIIENGVTVFKDNIN